MRTSLLCLVSLLTACNIVEGNGNVTSADRTVTAFHSVSIASGFTATVGPGTTSLTLRADENLMQYIETLVEGDSLVVRIKQGMGVAPTALEVAVLNNAIEGIDASGGSRVTASATTFPSFPVNASGGSDVTVNDLSSPHLDVDASGGSTVTLHGTAMSATANPSGGSTVDLTGVPLDTLTVNASGASTLRAKVSNTVSGNASGGSTVVITGNPTLSVESSGGSKVTSSP